MSRSATGSGIRKWYVLRTFSGHEKKVKEYLERETERLNLDDRLAEVLIPTETVFEMRAGKKKQREKTSYPGYILLHALIDPYLKEVIAGAPSTIGFLGANGEAVPLRPDEVSRILGHMAETEAAGAQLEIPFKEGDAVKVVDGPFNTFTGFVEEVFPDKMKLRVMVSIFGRKTPLELDYLQVEHES